MSIKTVECSLKINTSKSFKKDADADDTKQTGSQTVCVIFHGSPLCRLVRGYLERLKLSCATCHALHTNAKHETNINHSKKYK
ncbi:hypothetical protein T4C_8561 [Trichinella pseudospiralis]|uniref:Uncharacterized protein n=1 Tax=Trichinella pseudospiralis TaxID=6337 RepID=A0A0V1JY24_TRIPS|nr:hypothetical protein T4C_8561 [Trichinella pseudospiralis]